jgi:RHS repeat-associated protein
MSKSEHTAAPAGTGNTPGLGESFSINLSTGQGTYVYKMPLPDGVAKHTPKLAIEYAHGAAQGAFGLGWRMPLRSINRRLDFGGEQDALAERFMDSGMEIMPIADGTFRALRETVFSRYTRLGDGWKVEDRNGTVHELGLNPAARIADPARPTHIVDWLLERSIDVSGNEIRYAYLIDNGVAYVASIRYAIYEVRFVYTNRTDVRINARAGFIRRCALRCAKIELVLDPDTSATPIRSWSFDYAMANGSDVSMMGAIRLIAHGVPDNGQPDIARPVVRFQYSTFDAAQYRIGFMNHEGGPPPGLNSPDVALVTLDNVPLPGVLQTINGKSYYWPNLGDGRWDVPHPVAATPHAGATAKRGLAFVDMDGSGTADLMVADRNQLQGYYANDGRQGWKEFVAFPRNQRSTPDWANKSLRLADVDGNGLVDAISSQQRAFTWWRNRSTLGWSEPFFAPKSGTITEVDLSDPDVHFADMTGDGAFDLVRIRSGRIEYWPHLGRGQFDEAVLMRGAPRLRRSPGDTVLLVDLDGDGCADLVHLSAQGLTIYQNQNGQQFAPPVHLDTIPQPIAGTVRAVNLRGRAGAGLMWNSTTSRGLSYARFEFASEQPPYLLSEIDNGAGLRSELHYRSAIEDYLRDKNNGQFWTTNFPFPYLVVARTRESDLVSDRVVETEFQYHEAHFERHTRQFQGFRTTERIERGDESRADTHQVHHFLMAQERLPGNGPGHAALNGLLERVETFQRDGSEKANRAFRVETSSYGLDVLDLNPDGIRHRSFVHVDAYRIEDSERTDDVRIEEKTYRYDATGNVVEEKLRGLGSRAGTAQPSRERITTLTYASSNSHYVLDKISRVLVRDANGALLTEKKFFYDGIDFIGLPLGEVDRGLTARIEEWVMSLADFDAHYGALNMNTLGYHADVNADGQAAVFVATQRSRYDASGLAVASRDVFNNQTEHVYDADHVFRIKRIDTLGGTTFTYDRVTGQTTRIEYPNGATTEFAYDAQGRVLRSALPGQLLANAATVYQYDESVIPNRRVVSFLQQDGTRSLAITYFDGYGQEYQQRVEVEPGRVLVSAVKRYNPWGDLKEEFEPVYATTMDFALPPTDGRPSRRFSYDARGRAVRSINFNDGISRLDIEPFRVVVRDCNDTDNSVSNLLRGMFETPHEEEFDVLRYLVRVTDHLGAGKSNVTEYDTGAMGELTAVRDSHNTKFRYQYDRLGNRLVIDSRDSGERKIWYDARRKPVRTRDGANHEIDATWDALGRILRLASGATILEEYVYDTPSQQALGRLAEVRYPGGRQVFNYALSGQLLQRAFHYDGVANAETMQFEYDALGRELARVFADGTRIEQQLFSNGWVKSITGVIDAVNYDPRGLPVDLRYRNQVRTSYTYTPGPGRVARQETRDSANQLLHRIDYTFDKMDVMLASNDTSPGGVGLREYRYDPLYQLTSVASTENGAAVNRIYDFGDDYNLRRFDEANATLGYADGARPDRLTQMAKNGAVASLVSYDGNGNTLALPGQQFTYNVKNELTTFTRGDGLVADYRYDHLGHRISKHVRESNGDELFTRYVADSAEVNSVEGARYFVRLGSMRVAILHAANTTFVHESATGSTAFTTDAAGQREGSIDLHPFGNILAKTGSISSRTFSLHNVDEESGLVYMRRRYYAPDIGRFLTPDLMAIYQPEKFLHTPQALHLYAYVANDPLNKTDPNGMSFLSFLGSVVGVIVGIVIGVLIVAATVATGGIAGVLLGIGLALAASLAVTGVSYIIASNVDPNSAGGQFLRGFMIGFNAGMNGVLAGAIFGPVVGVALGVINFLATFDGVAQDPVYKGILGWTSWLMPMSWGATATGIVVFLINLVAAGITGNGDWWGSGAKIEKLDFDWRTGSFIMLGGAITGPTAFNAGHFVFVNASYADGSTFDRTYENLIRHETGHTLEVAAFGTAFWLADAIGENVVGLGANDYGEKIAESNVPGTTRPTIPMWG